MQPLNSFTISIKAEDTPISFVPVEFGRYETHYLIVVQHGGYNTVNSARHYHLLGCVRMDVSR